MGNFVLAYREFSYSSAFSTSNRTVEYEEDTEYPTYDEAYVAMKAGYETALQESKERFNSYGYDEEDSVFDDWFRYHIGKKTAKVFEFDNENGNTAAYWHIKELKK